MLTTIALLAALSLSDLPPAAKEANLTEAEYAKTVSGEVVVKGETYKNAEGKDSGKGKAWVVINASPEQCWATLYKYEQAATYMPRLKSVEVSGKSETGMKVRQAVGVALSTYKYTLEFNFNKAKYVAAWKLDKSAQNDIVDTTGSWTFMPLPDGKTLLDYSVTLDSGAAVPRFLADYLTKRDLPEVLLSFKRRVESGGTWTK